MINIIPPPSERVGRAIIGSFFAAGVLTLLLANETNSTTAFFAGWIMVGLALLLFRRPI